MCVLGADGANVRGGEQARHSSAGVAERLWDRVFSDRLSQYVGAEWDLFHRLDIAVRRAVALNLAAVELFDVSKVMNAVFGVGDGRAFFAWLRYFLERAGEARGGPWGEQESCGVMQKCVESAHKFPFIHRWHACPIGSEACQQVRAEDWSSGRHWQEVDSSRFCRVRLGHARFIPVLHSANCFPE